MKCIQINQQSKEKWVIDSVEPHIFFLYNYSGKLDISIEKENAHVYIFGLYIGKGDDQFNINTIQHHTVGKSVSDLLIKGVFEDNAKFYYEGLIQIDPGAHESNAYQKNQNLLLSKSAYVDSRPFLEIKANDVRCTHGSTTGTLDESQVQYLSTRGLTKEESKRVILDGFIDDIYQKIEALGYKESEILKRQLQLVSS